MYNMGVFVLCVNACALCICYVSLRMSSSCQKKCIPPKYHEAELSKGEAVCLDRCVAKYLEIHDSIGKKLTALSMSDEQTQKKILAQLQTQQK